MDSSDSGPAHAQGQSDSEPLCTRSPLRGHSPIEGELFSFLLDSNDSVLANQVEGLGLIGLDEDAVLFEQLEPLLEPLTATSRENASPPPAHSPPHTPPSPPPPPSTMPPSQHVAEAMDVDSDEEAEFVIVGVRAAPPPPPTLPPPPDYHQYNPERENCLDLGMYEEADAVYSVFQILDRMFEPPHQAYLVAWYDEAERFIGTWEWRDSFLSPGDPLTLAAVEWIDTWKDKYRHLTYQEYKHQFPLPFLALDDGQCFFAALRLACHLLGNIDLVPEAVMVSFVQKNAKERGRVDGVSKDDIGRFVKHMKDNRVQLACDVFNANQISLSLNCASDLAKYTLSDGFYVVGAKDAGGLGHCFVLQVRGSQRLALDNLTEEGGRVDYSSSSLDSFEWIRRIVFAKKVEKFKAAKKRNSRGPRSQHGAKKMKQ